MLARLVKVSIHAFRGEGDVGRERSNEMDIIVSIHAFRGEGDAFRLLVEVGDKVSIHAFRGEGDRRCPSSP